MSIQRMENKDEIFATKEKELFELQLGDIILIKNPTNDNINDKIFFIDYIDSEKMKLIGESDLNPIQLSISRDHIIGDGTISQIELLNRDSNLGYAKQNQLLPGTWINIYFGGDVPFILTGEITNLEEDRIEIQTLGPESDTIYINFEYKGLPEDLLIESIEIRPPPQQINQQQKEGEPSTKEDEYDYEYDYSGQKEISLEEDLKLGEFAFEPNKQVSIEKLKQNIIEADQIQFGEYLDSVKEFIDIEKEKYRYNIDIQTNDLLEQLLAPIPLQQRTPFILDNLHVMISRFIQLREMGSVFDKHKNIISISKKYADDKPLAEYLSTLQNKLYWILFVAKNNKKVYDIKNKEETESAISDTDPSTTKAMLEYINNLFVEFKSNSVAENQNRYKELYHSLNDFMTPSTSPNSDTNIIYTNQVRDNINVIVDNLGDMYSSAVSQENVINKRFVLQKYNTALTKLESGVKEIPKRVNISPNDILDLQSILTLPEPTIRFSKINLPGSSILTKSNLHLHFLNYWQLLKKKTLVNTVSVDSLDTDFDYNENNFMDNIKHFTLELENSSILPNEQTYKQFLKIIVPKIKVLFKLVKKYIRGKLSLLEVVGYLEPFMIYSHDLTYNQYLEITRFIRDKISEYNKNYVENGRKFALLKNLPVQKKTTSLLLEILHGSREIQNLVLEKYRLDNLPSFYTDSELLKKITLIDYGNLFNTSVAFENISLMFPNELSPIFALDKDKLTQTLEKDAENNKCINYVITKAYSSYEELLADNGIPVYFDKKYDNSPYPLVNEYAKERSRLTTEEFVLFLTDKLHKKHKYNPYDAEYLAETLTTGLKKVKDGQYAILIEETSPDQTTYYVRTNNEWIKDSNVKPELMAQEQDTLCFLQPDCLYKENDKNQNNGDCESIQLSKDSIVNNALKEIMNQFDKKYEISKQDLSIQLNAYLEKYASLFDKIESIEQYQFYKYNNQQYEEGLQVKETEGYPVSPYLSLRDIILGQSDFVKKQNDIIKFTSKYTRPFMEETPNIHDNELESPYWLYCIETNTKLLPTFLSKLAKTFIQNDSIYNVVLNNIVKEQGKLSDDGDNWVDEHSGYIIRAIEWDVEEGYEEGFKIRSRDVMEKDQSNILFEVAQKKKKLSNPQSQAILGMIQSLSSFIGVHLEDQTEFMITLATNLINDNTVLPREETYNKRVEERAKQGKKMEEYSFLYNSTVLYITLGAFLIGIQTSIPSVKTRKTFPGCVRSFQGFPLEGQGDLSALNYIACVAYGIRSPNAPWNVLSRMNQEKIAANMKFFLEKYLIRTPEVADKIKEKLEYLLVHPEDSIPQEHTILSWTNFLPPLKRIKIKSLQNISNGFTDLLLKDIRLGSSNQLDKILAIQSKIIEFSLAIQESIQKSINKKDLLLKSSLYPFMDNACCNEKGNHTLTTLQYFIKENKDIEQNNEIVAQLSAFMNDIRYLTEASIYLSSVDTKRHYTFLTQQFSEETIYQAFIVYCNFNSLLPIQTDLLSLCKEKPDLFSIHDTMEEQIAKLKRDGQHYTHASLLRLIQIVSRHHMVDMPSSTISYSPVQRLRDLLEKMSKNISQTPTIPKKLVDLLKEIVDTYDISVSSDTAVMRQLKNYLDSSNTKMRTNLLKFIQQKSKLQKNKYSHIESFIKGISVWEFDQNTRNENNKISDDAMYNYLQYFKTFIDMTIKVFPNMVLNEQIHSIHPPSYWGLSARHSKDISQIVESYYKPIEELYGDSSLFPLLKKIQITCENIILLAKETPTFTEIKIGRDQKTMYSVFDKRTLTLLFEYYVLLIFMEYIRLTEDSSLLKRVAPSKQRFTEAEELEEAEESYSTLEPNYIKGEQTQLKQKTAKLLVSYIQVMMQSKTIIDVSYDRVSNQVFKIKEREKDTFTDRLQQLTAEAREVDTIFKINKLGLWNKGLAKGIKEYDPENYDQEREMVQKITEIEKRVRKNNPNADERNISLYVEDYMEDMETGNLVDEEELAMDNMHDDYMDGYDYNEIEDEDIGQYD